MAPAWAQGAAWPFWLSGHHVLPGALSYPPYGSLSVGIERTAQGPFSMTPQCLGASAREPLS